MQKLIQRFGIALLSLTALSTIINAQGAKADNVYEKCYKFDRLLNEQELEYCRSAPSHQIENNGDAQIYPKTGIYNPGSNSINQNNIESITNIGCDIHCWGQLRLEEKQRKEQREHN